MEEKVFFTGEFGKICGVLHKAENKKKIVIVVHGFSSNKETSAMSISQKLNKIGVNALRIDLDNQGESDLDFKTGASIPNYVKQVESAIDYCKKLGYKEISLIGTSYGGLVVFATVLSHPEIKKLVLRVPVVDYKRHSIWKWGEENLRKWKNIRIASLKHSVIDRVNFNFIEKSFPYSMFDHAKKVQIPTLIIQGDKDESVEWQVAKEVVGLFPNAKLKMIKGADHKLNVNGDFSEGLKALTDFFRE